jgi:hypothetical protein
MLDTGAELFLNIKEDGVAEAYKGYVKEKTDWGYVLSLYPSKSVDSDSREYYVYHSENFFASTVFTRQTINIIVAKPKEKKEEFVGVEGAMRYLFKELSK